MIPQQGFLVLETGETYTGDFHGGEDRAGEVVFNTSHSGYEEIATDPSYFNQIIIMTAPMQGNYGVSNEFWESENIWINGFTSLVIQNSHRDNAWVSKLTKNNVPVVTGLDTRKIVLRLREKGTPLGALVQATSVEQANEKAAKLIHNFKSEEKDWANKVSLKSALELKGENPSGPRVAVLDFGCKKNILRELVKRTSLLKVFPSRADAAKILDWSPDGIMLSNGPGNPDNVEKSVETIQQLLGKKFIFGICMGHQLLCKALGASTYKLKFGHRGSNHPVKDGLLGKVYVTSQNHGYAVDIKSLPEGVRVTHTNLNDSTVSGIEYAEKNCLSVQFHPESHPGPHEAEELFDYFIEKLK